MNKGKSRRVRKLAAESRKLAGSPDDEGKWKIEFTFGGRKYTRIHRLNEYEVKHMKDLCVEHGDVAADQIIWRAAVKGLSLVSEQVMAEAGRDYVRENWKPRAVEAGVVHFDQGDHPIPDTRKVQSQ